MTSTTRRLVISNHFFVLPLVFCLGLYFDYLGFKMFAILGMMVISYVIFIVPIHWSLFMVFLFIGFQGFLKIMTNYHPVIHLGADFMVIALFAKSILKVYIKGIEMEKNPPFWLIFFFHFLWVGIVMFNPLSLSIISSLAGAKVYVTMFLLYFFGFFLTRSSSDVRFFMIPFIIIAVVHTVTGLYQAYYGPESVISLHPRYAVQLEKYVGYAFRPFGLTHLPGGPALFVAMAYPFILYFIFYFRSWFMKIAMSLFVPFSLILFLLCQVRSAFVKMILASAIFIMGSVHVAARMSTQLAKGLIGFGSVLALLIIFVVPQFMQYSVDVREENAQAIERSLTVFDFDKISNARVGAWDRFKIYAADIPLGAGFARVGAAAGAFKSLKKDDKRFEPGYFFADNFWLATLIEVGFPGMLLLTLLIFFIMYRGAVDYFKIKLPGIQVLHLAIFCSLIPIVLGLYGGEGVLYNPEAAFFWFFAGVLMRIPDLEKNSAEV